MPKVTPDYFDQKKERILNAALDVCKRKPLFQITMKDIIRETGISQGGIYRYYKSIDEILVAVMNKSALDRHYGERINHLVDNSKTASAAVAALFDFLADYIQANTDTLGKFHFELLALVAYEPERIKTISLQNTHVNDTQYFMKRLIEVIKNGVDTEEFKPDLPLNDILDFVSSAIDGIVMDNIFYHCYKVPASENGLDVFDLIETLKKAVLCLLRPGLTAKGKKNMEGDQ